jgi:putative oxidoreductase
MSIEIAALIGQILLGAYFIMAGAMHFMKMEMMKQYSDMKGVPMSGLAVPLTGLLLLLGGLSLLLGYQTFWGLILLLVFMVPTTFMMHNFWKAPKKERMNQMLFFKSNLAMIGALLLLLSLQTWPIALG